MLHSVKEIIGFPIAATDGELGSVDDLYFDDSRWTIRYLVVDTGGWISGRDTLIPLQATRDVNWAEEAIGVNLTKQQVKGSPGIDADKPLSRQHESGLHNHYGYPYYWSGPRLWGATAFPNLFDLEPSDRKAYEDLHAQDASGQPGEEGSRSDPHLRSFNEAAGYEIQTTDDTIGHVEDFLIDDKDWSIQLISVDTSNWLPGKNVLISPQRIQRVSWSEHKVIVNISKDELESSPEFDPASAPPLGPKYDLYRRFGMPHG